MSFLEIREVDKYYGDNKVLSDVNLTVNEGEVVCIIGPSGSGKSTLLRCINNLDDIQNGTITLRGEIIGFEVHGDKFVKLEGRAAARQRARFAMVFQSFQLFPHLSVLENITIGPIRIRKQKAADARQRARELLKLVGLEEKINDYPSSLSGGQQQRVAIARALAMEPEVLLFDEPTSALDAELVGEVLAIMRKLADDNRTMLIVTHELRFAQQVADRIIFFDKGSIVEEGAPDQLLNNPRHERTQRFLSTVLETT